ncbi:restriction endonuclease [Acinetobacter variabilis]|uniref:restriction endonuclease n=1 Tax=Acinetobacter variabilis TaxID=70346 RepID=UPI0028AB6ADC|nr:restriction endonuclease [Acinetobacter variabilis]
MQATASRQLDKINGLKEFRQRFAYLRKINHFVFEEMILEALERSGHKVYRNSRYTGDGGIDGRATINGVNYIVQAKRYSAFINKQHVIDFAALATQMGCRALFCHTGKTRESAKNIVAVNQQIEIISGQRLLDLLEGKYIPLHEKEGKKGMARRQG